MPRHKRNRSSQPKPALPSVADLPRFRTPLVLALILLTLCLVYLPAMRGGLVWDDDENITPPKLQSLGGLYRIWFDPAETAQYYPLMHTVFWLEHKLWGDAYVGYHLVNVLWHSLAAWLVFLILTRLKAPGALLAAAIFAVHPVMVESVAWMTEQKNTLSTVFYLSAMLVYLGFDESRRRPRYLLALGLFALALMTKTATVTLPVALLVIFWWQRGTLSWRRDVLPLVPFFVLSAAGGFVTILVEHTYIRGEPAVYELTYLQRSLLAGRDIWFYLGKLAWPVNLSFTYFRWTINPAQWWQWIFSIAALATTFALWAIRKRWRAPLAAWLFFCGTLFPVLGFVNVYMFVYTFVADHLQYLASLGIIALAAAGITLGVARLAQPACRLGIALCIMLVATLAVLSWRQSCMYADIVTLYQTTIDRNPNCWMAYNNLGVKLAATGNRQKAIEHYQSALRLKPDYIEAHNNLANALTREGRLPEAIDEFQIVLSLNDKNPVYHNNMANALTQMGRFSEAIDHCHEAIQLQRNYVDARQTLGNALIYANRLPEALDEIRAGLEIRPDDPVLHSTFAFALTRLGRFPEAAKHLERSLQLNPNSAEVHSNLAIVLAYTGQNSQAIIHFQRALELDHSSVETHNNFGGLLASTGKSEEAISHFEQALKLRPDRADIHNNIGDSLRQVGRFAQAVEHCQTALRLQPDYVQAYSSLAQALAAADRPQEAIAAAESGIKVARSAGQQAPAEQLAEWLRHYQSERQRSPAAKSQSTDVLRAE